VKVISVLGSTGSVGRHALEVIEHLGGGHLLYGLSAHSNIDLLEEQVKRYHPQVVAVYDGKKARELRSRLPHLTVLEGVEGLIAIAVEGRVNLVISSMSGTKGMLPTLRAIEEGKEVALANKEILVMAGELIMNAVRKHHSRLIPIDSEHSAIFQCLVGEDRRSIKRLFLTASGGPFFRYSSEELAEVTPDQALRHGVWKMGKKVTIDSSTLMNKGLEVIEAHHLFGVSFDHIEILIHPQSLVHSFVEFNDGALIAQVGMPDMRLPIQYALTYPLRQKSLLPDFDFSQHSLFEFFSPDLSTFLCLKLALEAGRIGGTMPCFMSAANEVLVSHFLEGRIGWLEIGKRLEKLMSLHQTSYAQDVEILLAVDAEARKLASVV